MKILIVQDADWNKKGPHQQHHLAEILSREGHEVHVVCFDQLWKGQPGRISNREVNDEVTRFYEGAKIKVTKSRFIRIPILDYLSYSFFSLLDIREEFDIFKPDVVISFTSLVSSWWAMRLANAKSVPNIYYWTDVIHSLIPFKPLKPLAKVIERRVIKGSTKVMAINEVLKDFIVNVGTDPLKIEIIPGGIDFQRFRTDIDGKDMRKRYGLEKDDNVLFFMGWLYDFSGLKEVIIDMINNREKVPQLKLVIVGEGDSYDELKKMVQLNDLHENVILTGWRPYSEIPSLIAAADYCILPAYNNEIMKDIVPIKLYEYLAMNKPVITTRLPGVIKEFGNQAGITYIDNPQQVISTVLTFNDQMYQAEKNRASLFIKKYSWDVIVPRFEDSLKNLVEVK